MDNNQIQQDFKSMIVGLTMYGSLIQDMHFVAKDSPKLKNAINTFLISPNVILYYS